jgi:hypothetical protein
MVHGAFLSALLLSGGIFAPGFAQQAPGINITQFGAACDGVTDDRVAIQSALDASGGRDVSVPLGSVCMIGPLPTKTRFLTIGPGTKIVGGGTLRIAQGSAPYDAVIYSSDCTGCLLSDIVIDSNVKENPIAGLAEIQTHPRIEIALYGGTHITVRGVTIMHSSAVNSIVVNGASSVSVAIEACTLTDMGDDPGHISHDASGIYIHADSAVVSHNHLKAVAMGSPSGKTGIETHGSQMTVADNVITNFSNGMNITGVASADSKNIVVSGNVITGAQIGMQLWSRAYGTHTAGHGIDGMIVNGNHIQIHQNYYPTPECGGIVFDQLANLPVANVRVFDNSIVFDLEAIVRRGSSTAIGIGWYSASGQDADRVSIEDNVIDNAPVAGIRMAAGKVTGLIIAGNTIRNAGSSLDNAIPDSYKVPVFIANGLTQGEVSRNRIIDDLDASRMRYAFLLAGKGAGSLQVLWNTVTLSGAVTASWAGYLNILDNTVKPLVKMIASEKPWAPASKAMAGGSQIYDSTSRKSYSLAADGIAWTYTQ